MGLQLADEHEVCFGDSHGFLDHVVRRVAIPTMSRHPRRVAAPPRYLADEPLLRDARTGGMRCQSTPDEHMAVLMAHDALPPMRRVAGESRHTASLPPAGSCP